MAGGDVAMQSVTGRVRKDANGTTVEFGPIALDAEGRARAEVTFDRPVQVALPLKDLFPDPEVRDGVMRGIAAVLECESERFDDILAVSGLDPATDLAGSDLTASRFVGTPDRPMDLRGWDLSGCRLADCSLAHVLVDATTNLEGVELEGSDGDALPEILSLVPRGGPKLWGGPGPIPGRGPGRRVGARRRS